MMKRLPCALKILTVIGARPQFVKAGPVSRAINSFNDALPSTNKRSRLNEIIVHTGQHYDENMSDIFFQELELPRPAYHLQVGSGSHGEQTGEMLKRLEGVMLKEKPDCVLVYGDTNSTLAGALVAAKLHIPVAHVEAGLRSFNRRMPEEVNRVLTDHISNLLFCPTAVAIRNLRKEGFTDIIRTTGFSRLARRAMNGRSSFTGQVVANVGDVMHDALRFNVTLAERRSTILDRLGLIEGSKRPSPYYLATVHRAENTDHLHRLTAIVKALATLNKHQPVIWPTHPRTLKIIKRSPGAGSLCSSLRIIEPVSYLDMLLLERHAKIILTDSGGVQKEAYWLGVPCVTLRDETEWVETVNSGWNVIAGADTKSIISKADKMCRIRARLPNVNIRDQAAERLVHLLHDFLRLRNRQRAES